MKPIARLATQVVGVTSDAAERHKPRARHMSFNVLARFAHVDDDSTVASGSGETGGVDLANSGRHCQAPSLVSW